MDLSLSDETNFGHPVVVRSRLLRALPNQHEHGHGHKCACAHLCRWIGPNLDAVKTTNWFGVSYALYAPSLQSHWGGGVGVFAPVTTNLFGTFNVLAGTRLDWVDGGFWMPSGNVSLEAPISVTSWLTLSPIAYAGIGVPVSGARVGNFNVPGLIRDNNDQATAITGAGLAVTIWKRSTPATAWYQPRSLQLAADVETWTGFAGPQYRFGISGHF